MPPSIRAPEVKVEVTWVMCAGERNAFIHAVKELVLFDVLPRLKARDS